MIPIKQTSITYKKAYITEVWKVDKGNYNCKTYLKGVLIFKEDNIKQPSKSKLKSYIFNKIGKYEIKTGNVIIIDDKEILKQKKIADTKDDFYYLDILKRIPKEYHNQKIWLQIKYKKSPIRKMANQRLRDFLNERFILHQLRQLKLSTPLPVSIEMSQREVWYYIEILAQRDNIPGKNVMDCDYRTAFTLSMRNYCRDIQEKVGVPYWGYVYDTLKIKAKARATIYEEDKDIEGLWKPIGLDKDTLVKYTNAPFFLVLCEKEGVITAFLKELLERGYNKDYFYCINTGGEASSNAIRLIREYIPIKNFHCFVLHDMDMSGLEIFFDMKRHFNCKSIGVNPDFLKHSKYDIKELKLYEKYRNKKGEEIPEVSKLLKDKAVTIFNGLVLSTEEKEKYDEWIKICIKNKIELNSITAHKIESSPTDSKTIDFVNYFIHIIEQEKWDLTRVRKLKKEGYSSLKSEHWTVKPKLDILQVEQPEFIGVVKEKGENKYIEESKAFLGKTEEIEDLFYDFYSQIKGIFNPINKKEETIKVQKINDFIDKNKLLFNVNWNNIIEDKRKTMKHGIKMLEKYLQLKSIKKYVITKRKLTSYIGSVKYPKSKIIKVEEEMGNAILDYKFNENKKIKKLNKVLKRCLKRTEEYKKAEEKALKLTKEIDKLEIKEDKRLEFLEKYKIRIEEVFSELVEDLNKFNKKIND